MLLRFLILLNTASDTGGGGGGGDGGSSGATSSSVGAGGESAPGSAGAPAASSSGAPEAGAGGARAAGDVPPGAPPPVEAPKWPKGKFKVKRGGAESEYDVETAFRMLSDDFEHEFPMGAGQPGLKLKHADIVRAVQRSTGAEDLMRKAAHANKERQERERYARDNPLWALQHLAGVEDPIAWMGQQLEAHVREEAELIKLAQSDHAAFMAKQDERAAKRLAQKTAFEQAQQERERRRAEATEAEKRGRAEAARRLKEQGLPDDERMMGHILRALEADYERGYRPPDPLGHAIAAASKAYYDEGFSWLDAVSDEQILELLGESRRERFRKLELQFLETGKGGKNKPAEEPRRAPSNGGGSAKQELTEAELRRRWQ